MSYTCIPSKALLTSLAVFNVIQNNVTETGSDTTNTWSLVWTRHALFFIGNVSGEFVFIHLIPANQTINPIIHCIRKYRVIWNNHFYAWVDFVFWSLRLVRREWVIISPAIIVMPLFGLTGDDLGESYCSRKSGRQSRFRSFSFLRGRATSRRFRPFCSGDVLGCRKNNPLQSDLYSVIHLITHEDGEQLHRPIRSSDLLGYTSNYVSGYHYVRRGVRNPSHRLNWHYVTTDDSFDEIGEWFVPFGTIYLRMT